jgi:hypothetical protein
MGIVPINGLQVEVEICVVGEAGLEPTTPGLEGRCSIQLSYSPVISILALIPAGMGRGGRERIGKGNHCVLDCGRRIRRTP